MHMLVTFCNVCSQTIIVDRCMQPMHKGKGEMVGQVITAVVKRSYIGFFTSVVSSDPEGKVLLNLYHLLILQHQLVWTSTY